MNQNPYSLLLDSVPWTAFHTGTLLGADHTTEAAIRRGWWAFIQDVYVMLGFPRQWVHDHANDKSGIDYFVRLERGEEGKRWHCHSLLFVPNKCASRRFNFALKALWEKVPANGMARVREIAELPLQGSSTALADYLCKLEENKYESSKFPSADSFILSPSLLPRIGYENWHTSVL